MDKRKECGQAAGPILSVETFILSSSCQTTLKASFVRQRRKLKYTDWKDCAASLTQCLTKAMYTRTLRGLSPPQKTTRISRQQLRPEKSSRSSTLTQRLTRRCTW